MRGIEPHQSRADCMKMYEEYYLNQTGSGLPGFVGARYQRGHGLGNMLRSLSRIVIPFIKKGVGKIGKQAVKSSMDIAHDAMLGKNIKAAAKKRVSDGLRELVTQKGRGGPPGERIKKMKRESGYKRKATSSKAVISHRTKRRRTSKKDALS